MTEKKDEFATRAYQKALSRKNDEERLANGEVTIEELRKENALSSLFIMKDAKIDKWV